jgi:hypothetical protein
MRRRSAVARFRRSPPSWAVRPKPPASGGTSPAITSALPSTTRGVDGLPRRAPAISTRHHPARPGAQTSAPAWGPDRVLTDLCNDPTLTGLRLPSRSRLAVLFKATDSEVVAAHTRALAHQPHRPHPLRCMSVGNSISRRRSRSPMIIAPVSVSSAIRLAPLSAPVKRLMSLVANVAGDSSGRRCVRLSAAHLPAEKPSPTRYRQTTKSVWVGSRSTRRLAD